MKISLYIDGKLIKENDLLLNNYRDLLMLGVLGKGNNSTTTATVTLTAEDDSSNIVEVGHDYNDTHWFNGGSGDWSHLTVLHTDNSSARRIEIGTGTTTPTKADHAMEVSVATESNVTVNALADKVVFSATFTLSADTDITEAALARELFGAYNIVGTTGFWFLMTHDTFDAVTFSAGVPRTVSIEISF